MMKRNARAALKRYLATTKPRRPRAIRTPFLQISVVRCNRRARAFERRNFEQRSIPVEVTGANIPQRTNDRHLSLAPEFGTLHPFHCQPNRFLLSISGMRIAYSD